MNSIDESMHAAVDRGVFPGAVLLIGKNESIVHHEAYGTIGFGQQLNVTKETVFDLASLTKPLATTLAVLKLIMGGLLKLDTQLGDIPVFVSNTPYKSVTLAQLLSHTSGLPAHQPYFEILKNLPQNKRISTLREKVFTEPPACKPDNSVIYSDLGFMILGWLVERVTGMTLDAYVTEHIYRPLSVETLFFPVHDTLMKPWVYAETEKCPWRCKTIQGEVHDDNAWSAGVALGHTGLFGSALGVWTLLKVILGAYYGQKSSNEFDSALVRLFLSEYKKTGRSLGFDMPSEKKSSSGDFFSKNSVGHLGFTGGSFWCDLDKRITVILLTNRVNPTRDNIKIRKFRPVIHNQIMTWLSGRK